MRFLQLISISLLLTLSACGGGGSNDQSTAGIGGTGAPADGKTTGTVTGFGSIFVNGIEFETGTANIIIDGVNATESQLKLGMVVNISGSFDRLSGTGEAVTVEFDDNVQGPVSAITLNADGSKQLTILGGIVIVDPIGTVFDGVSFDTLTVGDLLEASGFYNASGELQATRIEKKTGSSEIELKGVVSGLGASSFSLGSYSVDFSGASEIEGPLENGRYVEVKGNLAATTISASSIHQQDDFFSGDEAQVSLEGFINNLAGNFFIVNGQPVDASSASRVPSSLTLSNNMKVEVEGTIVGGLLQASRIEARSSRLKLSAQVNSISGQTITLQFRGGLGLVSFLINSSTRMEDDTGAAEPFTLADINTLDFLEVKLIENSGAYYATELKRASLDSDELRGPVEAFTGSGGSNSTITLFGITYTINGGTEFRDASDAPLSGSAFFSSLDTGDVVELQDARPTDSFANEIEMD